MNFHRWKFDKILVVIIAVLLLACLLMGYGIYYLIYEFSHCSESSEFSVVVPTSISNNRQVITPQNVNRLVQIASVERPLASRWNLAFSPGGTMLASGGENNSSNTYPTNNCATVWLWHIPNISNNPIILHSPDRSSIASNVVFNSDGTILAVPEGGVSGTLSLRLWDMLTNQELAVLPANATERSIVFNPSNTALIYGNKNGEIRLWDIEAREEIATLQGHQRSVSSLAINPSGTILASAGEDTTIQLWNLETLTQLSMLQNHTDYVIRLAFSPDGTYLASNSSDGQVLIWNMTTNEQQLFLNAPTWNLLFSPVSNLIATDRGVWDIELEEQLINLNSQAQALTFSPNGDLMVVGDRDGELQFWDIVSATEVHVLSDFSNAIRDVEFSPDGTLIASVSSSPDGVIHLWAVQ